MEALERGGAMVVDRQDAWKVTDCSGLDVVSSTQWDTDTEPLQRVTERGITALALTVTLWVARWCSG